jgi:hypothetical protein
MASSDTDMNNPSSRPSANFSMSEKPQVPLRPTITDLNNGNPNLQKMVRFIGQLIHDSNAQIAGHNAALTYLAIMTAFQHAGLVELDWAPVLAIAVGDTEYQVSDSNCTWRQECRS